ncbi:MAG: double-strand break repair protein AddB, partial [Sphingorhabdus sp.]
MQLSKSWQNMKAADRQIGQPGIFNVPIGTHFADATVNFILDQKATELSISDIILLLPNNRAIKAMTEAFVRQAAPGMLLPRMVAIGDMALDETLGPLLDPLVLDEPIWPVIEPAHRLMLLAELVVKYRKDLQPIKAAEALRLARKLAELIDELEIEEVAFERFAEISVEADLAEHWQRSYGQLLLILKGYRIELAKRRLLGPSDRRNQLLDRLEHRLRVNPFERVVACGITTSARSITRVLKRIAQMPQGSVIMPGLDTDMPEAQWAKLGPHVKSDADIFPPRNHETHPQFHLKLLMDRMGVQRDDVENIVTTQSIRQAGTISEIFCMPEQTADWRDLPGIRKQLPHVTLLEASDSAEEARAIAIKVRASLERVGQRICIVTPDRELAVRVSAQLNRWEILVDDSAGIPILQTPHGTMILALAEAIADRFSPVALLAVAKHPLVHSGDERLEWLDNARKLDLLLRGPAQGVGLNAINFVVQQKAPNDTSLHLWWKDFSAQMSILHDVTGNNFSDVMQAIQSVADNLTQAAVWRGTTGRQLASLWEQFATCNLAAMGHADQTAIPAILAEMLGYSVVRPPYGGHPRVAIYGLLEARMQRADIMICGGLNEASWPQLAQPDPWLAPAIRRTLGLPTLDRNVGLSAHDLATALGATEVLLTRAKRDRSGPTVASRFVLRIKALLGDQLQIESGLLKLAGQIDRPVQREPLAPRPTICPSLSQRRVALSITDFDQLKSDPYSFYAKNILRLRSLEPVDA